MIEDYMKNRTLNDKMQDSTVLVIAVIFTAKVVLGL